MAKVVILGAGLTGLSTAYHLEKDNFFDYKIFERNDIPGGLCGSVNHEGFTFDYTGHLLHINNPYFKQFLKKTIFFKNLNLINRRSFIYSKNVFTKYPFQTNLYGLPTKAIVECIEGFLTRPNIEKPSNFYEWVLKHFGSGIGKHFLFPYQTKIFAFDVEKLLSTWTGRFVPSTNLRSIIEGSIRKSPREIGYNSRFYYPKTGGIQALPDSIAQELRNKVHTNFNATFIDTKNKVVHFGNGHEERYDRLVTTLPLDTFLQNIKTPSSVNFKTASKKLLCTSLVNFNLGINIPKLTTKHWVYFPEKKYAFYRIGFWNNFSRNIVPEGCSSLYGEFSYLPNTKNKQELNTLAKKCVNQVVPILKLSKSNLVTQKKSYLDHAYVIYDAWREKNLGKIHQALSELSVLSVGRFGEWKYSSMQEAILDGRECAEKILTQKFHGARKTTIEEMVIPKKKEQELSL